ncbi:MAG: hypothetical protein IKW30_03765 [Lachnospiraceae bacterium]|nr:hypothetical protein [Lachnospiraceae bacterium]
MRSLVTKLTVQGIGDYYQQAKRQQVYTYALLANLQNLYRFALLASLLIDGKENDDE